MASILIRPAEKPDPSYLRLISAVVVQAVKDARSPDLILALDASLWLAGPDAPLYLQAVGMGDADPIALLVGGRIRRSSWRWLSDEQ